MWKFIGNILTSVTRPVTDLRASFSAGISAEVSGYTMLTGHNGSVLDQSGTKMIIKDGLDVNYSICPGGVCVMGEVNIDTKSNELQANSAGLGFGFGEIGEVGFDLIQKSDWFLYSKRGETNIQVPFLH